jgi:aspartate/tyrosine/aromatic aminotransferase
MFNNIELAPVDPILGLNEAFVKDNNPEKINLGVGVYKNETGKTPILDCVKIAEKEILEEEKTKSYLPISGKPSYINNVKTLLIGENHEILKSNRIATVQSLGGTGALRICADFSKKFLSNPKVWISDPTWENHYNLFTAAGFEVCYYPYFERKSMWIDFDKTYDALSSNVQRGDIVLLHTCCHNPTGVDLNTEQWEALADLCAKVDFIPLFDFAYQGFGDGIVEDSMAIQVFSKKVKNFFIANSFSKNFGLYNERIGALSVVTDNQEEAGRVLSQLKICVRTNFSNPPVHGASIVDKILSDPKLFVMWENEVKEMRDRIKKYRKLFVDSLKGAGVDRDFEFITKQNGMFSYTGLTKGQVHMLREKYAIYFVDSGRINLAGINNQNIEKICGAFSNVL